MRPSYHTRFICSPLTCYTTSMTLRIGMFSAGTAGLTLAVLNILIWQSPWLGLTAGAVWIVGTVFLAGSFKREGAIEAHASLGLLTILCLIILAGSVSFYLGGFTDIHAAFLALILPAALLVIDGKRENSLVRGWLQQESGETGKRESKLRWEQNISWLRTHWMPRALIAAYGALYVFAVIAILNHQTDEAIRSPWEALPRSLFFIYFLLTFILFLLIRRGKMVWPHTKASRRLRGLGTASKAVSEAESRAAIPAQGELTASFEAAKPLYALLALHFFLSFSLALLVYRIGFGFDPFVHRATEIILANSGTITPKPYLYVGQYTLVVFLAKLLALPLALIDKWLLPILASLLAPSLIIFSFKKTFQLKPHHVLLATLSLLALPVYFIVTIPQPFANLLYLLLILLSLPYLSGRHIPLLLLWGLGITAFFIHAIAGIPALVYLTLITILSRPALRFRGFLMFVIPAAAALAIPGLVAVGNMLNGNGVPASDASIALPALVPHYLPFLSLAHTAELWHRALPLFFLSGAIAGTYLLWKHGRRGLTIVPWIVALSLAGSYLLLRSVNLSAIIVYERAEFTERILELFGITLLPLVLYALVLIWQRLCETPKKFIFASVVAAALTTIGWYYAYPRVDAFAKSRGFSVSQSDIDAVQWIENNAAGEPYVVLANQSVAAAALQEFGFKQYFLPPSCISEGTPMRVGGKASGPLDRDAEHMARSRAIAQQERRSAVSCAPLFYYPIPTSSPLYQYYLDMVYREASRATILQAMELAGVRRAYFVLNDYWLGNAKIAARAAQDADATIKIDSVTVLVYSK